MRAESSARSVIEPSAAADVARCRASSAMNPDNNSAPNTGTPTSSVSFERTFKLSKGHIGIPRPGERLSLSEIKVSVSARVYVQMVLQRSLPAGAAYVLPSGATACLLAWCMRSVHRLSVIRRAQVRSSQLTVRYISLHRTLWPADQVTVAS